MPKCLTILFCITLLAGQLRAETDYVTMHSLSRQFVVHGPRVGPIKRSSRIPLDPAILAVSCERIKRAVLLELGSIERSQLDFRGDNAGKIYVVLHPGYQTHPLITPIKNAETFSYRVDLPDEIEATALVEAITQATLLELANRRAGEKITQIPLWLAQGISARVRGNNPETLVLEPSLPLIQNKVRVDPNAKIRQNLKNFSPLTFEELSWPERLDGTKTAHFDECSQLFVNELLRLKDGQACLSQMLHELANHLNWQAAFLHAFHPHFTQLVEVEKWWGLRVVNLTGRDSSLLWSREQTAEKVDAVLRVSVEIRSNTDALPSRRDLTLQEIISEADAAEQKRVLSKTISQLQVLRMRVQPESAGLLDEYRTVLESYLEGREKHAMLRLLRRSDNSDVKDTTLARLNLLDEKRALLRKKANPITREQAMQTALEVASQRIPITSTKQ